MSDKIMSNRLIKAISNFSFSNEFVKEKTGKAFSFMIVCFLLFSLISVGAYIFKVQPQINKTASEGENLLSQMSEFKLNASGFDFVDGSQKKIYESESLMIVIDIDETKDIVFIKNEDKLVLHIDEKAVYLDDVTALEYDLLTGEFNKKSVLNLIQSADTIAKIVLVIWLIVMFILLLVLSVIAWIIVVIVNGFVKKDIKKGDCYKIGVYAMTLPNILLAGLMFTGTSLPGFMFVYVGLLGFYSYMFLKNYRPKEKDLLEIFE